MFAPDFLPECSHQLQETVYLQIRFYLSFHLRLKTQNGFKKGMDCQEYTWVFSMC